MADRARDRTESKFLVKFDARRKQLSSLVRLHSPKLNARAVLTFRPNRTLSVLFGSQGLDDNPRLIERYDRRALRGAHHQRAGQNPGERVAHHPCPATVQKL